MSERGRPLHSVARCVLRTGESEMIPLRAVGAYVDPAAALVATAVADVLRGVRAAGRSAPDPDTTGIVVTSALATTRTMSWLVESARRGRSSPLRFAAAGPGTLAGVACSAHGLRGPSAVLLGAAAELRSTAEVVARDWLGRGRCGHVILVVHGSTTSGGPGDDREAVRVDTVECELVRRPSHPTGGATGDDAVRW